MKYKSQKTKCMVFGLVGTYIAVSEAVHERVSELVGFGFVCMGVQGYKYFTQHLNSQYTQYYVNNQLVNIFHLHRTIVFWFLLTPCARAHGHPSPHTHMQVTTHTSLLYITFTRVFQSNFLVTCMYLFDILRHLIQLETIFPKLQWFAVGAMCCYMHVLIPIYE